MLNPSTDMWLAIRTTVNITIISRICTSIVLLVVLPPVFLFLLPLPLLLVLRLLLCVSNCNAIILDSRRVLSHTHEATRTPSTTLTN